MNKFESLLLAGNIACSLIAVFCFTPKRKVGLFSRVGFLIFVFGANAIAVFNAPDSERMLRHGAIYYQPFCLFIALHLILGWTRRKELG